MIKDILKNDKNKIPELAFHTMTHCDNLITIYGGMSQKDKIRGDVYFLKINSTSITKASYRQNKTMFPSPRHSHTADYDSTFKRLFIFGGYQQEEPHYLNQLCILELKSFPTIVFQSVKSLNITNRCRHSSFMSGRKLYIYGGYGMDSTTKQIKILNDFQYLEIDSGKLVQVTSKGGSEMEGSLFKIIQIENLEFAFFSENFYKFFIFNTEKESFTKIDINFSAPSPRDFFSLDKLTDGRIVLIGGSKHYEYFNEIYYLTNYTYDQNVFWLWSRVDVYGTVDNGYNGHCTLRLSNNHILIHGGTVRSLDCLNLESVKHEPIFNPRFQIFDIHYSLEWIIDPTLEEESLYKNEYHSKLSDNRSLYPSIMHICIYIPKESDEFAKFIIHGGDNQGKILCKYNIYNLDENKWMPNKKEDHDNQFIPQLKGHAYTNYWIKLNKNKEHYAIISGGITIEHGGPDCKISNSQKVSNTIKQNCPCKSESISSNLYAFQRNIFSKINIIDTDKNKTLKRYGHSMVYLPEKDLIFMLCGFIQYEGFVLDLVQLEIKRDEEVYRKSKQAKRNDIDLGLFCNIKSIDLTDHTIDGRMFASVTVAYNHIIIYGGIKDEVVLGDMHLINMNNLNKPVITKINIDTKVIAPRFGMSGVVYLDDLKEDVGRLIIFGGTFFDKEKLIDGVSSEVVVFKINYFSSDTTFNIDTYIPIIYGYGFRQVYHTASLHGDGMYIYGNLDTDFQKLVIPSYISYEINMSLNEYEQLNPGITFQDWENGLSLGHKEKKSLNKSKNNNSYNSIQKEIDSPSVSSKMSSKNSVHHSKASIDLSDEEAENLLNQSNKKSQKNLNTSQINYNEDEVNTSIRIINKKNNTGLESTTISGNNSKHFLSSIFTNNLIQNKSSSNNVTKNNTTLNNSQLNESSNLINDRRKENNLFKSNQEIELKEIKENKENPSENISKFDSVSKSQVSQKTGSKKGFVLKKKKKTNNWDDDY